MGESAVLLRSFSHPSDASREAREVSSSNLINFCVSVLVLSYWDAFDASCFFRYDPRLGLYYIFCTFVFDINALFGC